MKRRIYFAITAVIGLCSANLIFANTASAQMSWEVQQLVEETDALIEYANDFIQHTEQQRQQEMNALFSACNSGNASACTEYQVRLNIEDRAIDNYIEIKRNRRLCGSPVCY